MANEGVEKPRTLQLLAFSLYFGYAFTIPKIVSWIVERSMKSHFAGLRQALWSGPFSTASTTELSGRGRTATAATLDHGPLERVRRHVTADSDREISVRNSTAAA